METLSSPSTGHHRSIKILVSPTIRAKRIFASPDKSTMNHVVGLTKQKVRMPRASPSPTGDMELASIPITPDPFSSFKSTKANKSKHPVGCSHPRLNKFVRRLHDMLVREKHSGIVEWRRGLLVLFSTDAFSKRILPKYFNTRNFKTFRRQLNYYGFVHVQSFSATGNTTTALWINQNLAEDDANDDVSAVLKLRRVEPNEVTKTVEGRRLRKELAIHTVEEDIGLNSKMLQLDQIRSMTIRGEGMPCRGQLYARNSSQGHSTGSITTSHIHQVDSENSMRSSSGSVATFYSSNDDACKGESSEFTLSVTKPRDEAANTNAAASVLLMLSRS